jgi:hypothetical protein
VFASHHRGGCSAREDVIPLTGRLLGLRHRSGIAAGWNPAWCVNFNEEEAVRAETIESDPPPPVLRLELTQRECEVLERVAFLNVTVPEHVEQDTRSWSGGQIPREETAAVLRDLQLAVQEVTA